LIKIQQARDLGVKRVVIPGVTRGGRCVSSRRGWLPPDLSEQGEAWTGIVDAVPSQLGNLQMFNHNCALRLAEVKPSVRVNTRVI